MKYHPLPQPDEVEVREREDAYIEPRTLATFFRKLKEEKDNALLEKFEIVSTHPNFTSRIRDVLAYEPEVDFESVPLGIDWEEMQQQILLEEHDSVVE